MAPRTQQASTSGSQAFPTPAPGETCRGVRGVGTGAMVGLGRGAGMNTVGGAVVGVGWASGVAVTLGRCGATLGVYCLHGGRYTWMVGAGNGVAVGTGDGIGVGDGLRAGVGRRRMPERRWRMVKRRWREGWPR